ncbi:MAG: hypothetical protein A2014_11900 [Spirochaetes bacterium GWF1_49_6]|nr:MAG: hypothetical protein A2014_11900 [Spirochaetes bacterium GWF1_49_6]
MPWDDIRIEVSTHFLAPGMVLKGDGFDEKGTKVIEKDVALNENQIKQILACGVKTITYTRKRLKLKKENSTSSIADEHIDKAMAVLDDIEGAIRGQKNEIPAKEVKEVVDTFIEDIRSNNDTCLNLLDLADYDDYTYTHSINVATISLACGLAMNLDELKIRILGTAAILHDIGKTLVPIEILNKPDKLTPAEWAIMKKHPLFAYNILKAESQFSKDVINGVLLHHEDYTGGGYPLGIRWDKSNIFAQIISIADVFDAITSKRTYKTAQPFSNAFGFIMEKSGTKFNPEIAQVFLKEMIKKINGEPLYPVNSYVLLNTGEVGYVVDHRLNPFSLRPIINIFYNPAKEPKLLKYKLQIDLEKDNGRTVIRRIMEDATVQKFNQVLNLEGM